MNDTFSLHKAGQLGCILADGVLRTKQVDGDLHVHLILFYEVLNAIFDLDRDVECTGQDQERPSVLARLSPGYKPERLGSYQKWMSADSDPTVSIIIPTYNRGDIIERAIDSVLNQTYSDFELIVVDDASTDNTQEIVSEYTDPRIEYVKKEQNMGGSAARNTGIQRSRGEFIAFCDSDDEWIKTKLEKQMEVIRMNDCVAVYCRHYTIEDEYNVFRKSSVELKSGQIYDDLLQGWCPASTSLFLVKKEELKEVDGFDSTLSSFQDYDLWLRLAQDYPFCYVDEYLVIKHNHYGEQLTTSPDKLSGGLETFLEKWGNEIMDEHDRETANNIRDEHLSQVYFNQFLNNRIEGNFWQSLLYGCRYIIIKIDNPNLKRLCLLFIIFFAGKKGNEFVQSTYYNLFWQQTPIDTD